MSKKFWSAAWVEQGFSPAIGLISEKALAAEGALPRGPDIPDWSGSKVSAWAESGKGLAFSARGRHDGRR